MALRAALLGRAGAVPAQYDSRFLYLEFDVQETADGRLVLFHDNDLARMLPEQGANKTSYQKIYADLGIGVDSGRLPKTLHVHDLTYAQLSTLSLKGTSTERVPLLAEFLADCERWRLVKPLTLEIKKLYSDRAEKRVVSLLQSFRSDYMSDAKLDFEMGFDLSRDGVSILAFKHNFDHAFGPEHSEPHTEWCQYFRRHGFARIYKARRHHVNLCNHQ